VRVRRVQASITSLREAASAAFVAFVWRVAHQDLATGTALGEAIPADTMHFPRLLLIEDVVALRCPPFCVARQQRPSALGPGSC